MSTQDSHILRSSGKFYNTWQHVLTVQHTKRLRDHANWNRSQHCTVSSRSSRRCARSSTLRLLSTELPHMFMYDTNKHFHDNHYSRIGQAGCRAFSTYNANHTSPLRVRETPPLGRKSFARAPPGTTSLPAPCCRRLNIINVSVYHASDNAKRQCASPANTQNKPKASLRGWYTWDRN